MAVKPTLVKSEQNKAKLRKALRASPQTLSELAQRADLPLKALTRTIGELVDEQAAFLYPGRPNRYATKPPKAAKK